MSLIKSGKVVSEEVASRVTLKKSIGSKDDPADSSTLNTTDDSDVTVEVKKEPNCGIGLEAEEPFVKKPGNVVTLQDVTVDPGQSKVIVVALCDAPRICIQAKIQLFAARALNDTSGTISESATLLQNFKLEVTLSNDHKSCELTIPRGTVSALAVVADCQKDVFHPRSSAVYCYQLLRHYCMVTSGDMSDVTVDDAGMVCFGQNFEVVLDKDSEVLFNKTSTFSQCYTVSTVVSFLTHYKSCDASSYANYLQAAIRADAEDFVDERDAEAMFKLMHGLTKSIPKPKKNRFKTAKKTSGEVETNFDLVSFEGFPNCLIEVGNFGEEFLSKVIGLSVDRFKMNSQNDAKLRLEDFLTLLHDSKVDCRQLQKQATRIGKSRQIFENFFWQKMVRHYEDHPNAFNECSPLKNESCLDSVISCCDVFSMPEKFSDVFSLVRIFPSDNVGLIEQLVTISEDKTKIDLKTWPDDAKEELQSFAEKLKSSFEEKIQLEDLPIKCEDRKKQRLSVYAAFHDQVNKISPDLVKKKSHLYQFFLVTVE